jgi:hypothetical protein
MSITRSEATCKEYFNKGHLRLESHPTSDPDSFNRLLTINQGIRRCLAGWSEGSGPEHHCVMDEAEIYQ